MPMRFFERSWVIRKRTLLDKTFNFFSWGKIKLSNMMGGGKSLAWEIFSGEFKVKSKNWGGKELWVFY